MAALMTPIRGIALRQARSRLACQRAAPQFIATRYAATAAGSKVVNILQGELKHEQGNYEEPKEVGGFLKSSPFKFVQADGDVNMMLEREVGDKVVKIEWQLTSPFDPEGEEEDGQEDSSEATELSITAEDKKTGAGVAFYCSTQPGEDHRYVIGNVKTFANAQERDSVSGYNGPEFEDLDDKLQEAFDEYLGELGMSSDVCDFVDAMALDKEQREYVNWLKNAKAFLES